MHGAQDDFIPPKHSQEIVHRFGAGQCRLLTPPGGHNTKRPRAVYLEAW